MPINQRHAKPHKLDAEKSFTTENNHANEKVTKAIEREIVEKLKVSDDGSSKSKAANRTQAKKSKTDNRTQINSQKPIVSAMLNKKLPKKDKVVSIKEEKNTEIGQSNRTANLPCETGGFSDEDKVKIRETEQERIERMAKVLAKQYLWTSAAVLSFFLGIGCLFLSREYQTGFSKRRWSRR